MLFVNGLSINISLYVHSKHPQTVEKTIREATTYDNITTINKSNNIKYNPFLKASSNVELNAIKTYQQQRLQRHATSFSNSTTKDDCFKYGLCFYCKESGHRALQCSKRVSQHQHSSDTSHQKKDLK